MGTRRKGRKKQTISALDREANKCEYSAFRGSRSGKSQEQAPIGELRIQSSKFAYIGRLRPFLSLDDLEFDSVALLQALISIASDGAVVDEDVRSTIAPQEAVALCIVEPLHCAFYTIHFVFSLFRRFPENGTDFRGQFFSVATF